MNNKKFTMYKAKCKKICSQEEIFKYFFLLSSLLSVFLLLLISIFIFKDFFKFIAHVGLENFLFNADWFPLNIPPSYGILSMIVGSILVTFLACLIAVPLSILVASYLAFDCPTNIYKILKPSLNLMAGIPSIVYGFFALTIIVPLNRNIFGGDGMNMLTAAILLVIMILPTITTISEASLRTLPQSFYQGSLALGVNHDTTILRIMLPAAKSGIFAGVILGIGRAIGETMAVILVLGNQTRLTFDPLQGIRTLTTNIVLEMSYATGTHQEALIATGGVLFIFILTINLTLFCIKIRSQNHKNY